MSNPIVLVVGAAGRFAGLLVPELVRRGATVRALVRSEANAAVARKAGAAEIALGDLRDAASLEAAARGARGIFHIGPAFAPDESELGLRMVGAAKRAGVRRFVFSSVMHPTNARLGTHAMKQPVEEALFGSGLAYTILQPTNFYQNIELAWPAVLAHGVFAEPFAKTAPVARVDYRDVAEVAAKALTEDHLAYGTFELCGEEQPTREDIVALMGEALGRPKSIAAAEPSFAEWRAMANPPYDERQLGWLASIFAYYNEHGIRGNTTVLRTLLGRSPRTLRAYVGELAQSS
ncbi:NmrA family NAD(P)-binding protein [Pendulispora rubella]|uniref:NmrA family NAD(P)-binding protein n=1 Tax=Pendulispora rubella TaxID=2741070 RepID=A0ABZ2KPZ6_9BACT